MPGPLPLGTSGCSSRPGCSITNGTAVIVSTTSIGADSSSCGIGLPGFLRTLTDSEDGGTHDDEEKGDKEDDGEEACNFGCAESVSHQRRGGKPRPGGGLLRQVVRARRAKAGGLALLLHLWSGDIAGSRCLVRGKAAPGSEGIV